MKSSIIRLLYMIMLLAGSLLVAGCGSSDNATAANDTGSIIARLVWGDAREAARAKTVALAPAGVTTVRFIISGMGMTTMQQDFPAAAGTGTISSVLAGSGRTFTAQGLNSSGAVTYQGVVYNVLVQPGKTVDLGVITMNSLTPPNAPSGLLASAVSADMINLAWTDNASDEAGFKIERKIGVDGTYAQIGTVGANEVSYSDTGLMSSTTYYYRVRAYGIAGDSGYSAAASTVTLLPGTVPVYPPPAGLWQPTVGFTATDRNYVFLKSDAGDYIGQGRTYHYIQSNGQANANAAANGQQPVPITVTATGGHLVVRVDSNTSGWTGDFQIPSSMTQLQPGYYGSLQRYPFHDPLRGGLNWSGEGRGSNTLTGWFVIDSVTYANGVLTAIDLRFEQHSEGMVPALHGMIHWVQ